MGAKLTTAVPHASGRAAVTNPPPTAGSSAAWSGDTLDDGIAGAGAGVPRSPPRQQQAAPALPQQERAGTGERHCASAAHGVTTANHPASAKAIGPRTSGTYPAVAGLSSPSRFPAVPAGASDGVDEPVAGRC